MVIWRKKTNPVMLWL